MEFLKIKELRRRAKSHGVRGFSKMKKDDLVDVLSKLSSYPTLDRRYGKDPRPTPSGDPDNSDSVFVNPIKPDVPIELNQLNLRELRSMAKEKGLSGYSKLNKSNIIGMLNG